MDHLELGGKQGLEGIPALQKVGAAEGEENGKREAGGVIQDFCGYRGRGMILWSENRCVRHCPSVEAKYFHILKWKALHEAPQKSSPPCAFVDITQ